LIRLPNARPLAVAGLTVLGVVLFATVGGAALPDSPQLTGVAQPNLKTAGYTPSPKLSKELQEVAWAQGGTRLENPTALITDYGYQNDVAASDDPGKPQIVPTSANMTEAQKTEPDKNTYLVFKQGLKGPDASYDYGKHFVFQGHEAAATVSGAKQGYITRVNLDADAQHRVTLLATQDTQGHPLATIDGSTWDPFAKRLLFTTARPSTPRSADSERTTGTTRPPACMYPTAMRARKGSSARSCRICSTAAGAGSGRSSTGTTSSSR
jgi:hypothetical protein